MINFIKSLIVTDSDDWQELPYITMRIISGPIKEEYYLTQTESLHINLNSLKERIVKNPKRLRFLDDIDYMHKHYTFYTVVWECERCSG